MTHLLLLFVAFLIAPPVYAGIGCKEDLSESAPYVVRLQMGENGRCTGTVVDRKYVLTAAHCVYKHKAADIRVSFGRLADQAGPVITRVLLFPAFHKPWDAANDVALLELEDLVPAAFSTELAMDDLRPGTWIRNGGYGRTTTYEEDVHLTDGIRRMGEIQIAEAANGIILTKESEILYGQVVANGEKSCVPQVYDSGSPILIQNRVRGVLAGSTELANSSSMDKTSLLVTSKYADLARPQIRAWLAHFIQR